MTQFQWDKVRCSPWPAYFNNESYRCRADAAVRWVFCLKKGRDMKMRWACLCLLLLTRMAVSQTLVNGGFEDAADGKVKGWHAYGAYACETEVVQAGARALRCEVPEAGKGQAGVMQEIVYARPDRAPVVFGGWSKAERVAAEDYCIYLDIWYEGGGNAWGVTANWSQPTHDWEYAAEIFYPEKG